jgi:long-chain acyl-CoA synthetase
VTRRVVIEAKPWLAHYDEGMPETLAPYPRRLIHDFLRDTVRERPAHPAVIFKGRRISAADLDRSSDRFAAALSAMGIGKGDRVALVLPNVPHFLIAEIGAWKAGAVVVALSPLLTERELRQVLVSTGATAVVVLSRFYERVKACQPGTAVRHVIVANIKEYLPPLLRALFTLFRERKEGDRVSIQPGDLSFQDVLRRGVASPPPDVEVTPEDPAVMLMSGGTTGTPKSVVGTHAALVASGIQLHRWLRDACHDWDDAFMLPLPLFHVYGCLGVQALAMVGHNPIVLVPNPRDIDDVVKTISRIRPAFLAAVPTLFIALLSHPRAKTRAGDFGSIKICFSGASALLAETKKRFEEMTGGRIVEGYSLTEAMMACCVNPVRGTNKIGSVGMPLPDVEVMILDADSGERRVESGDVGEIVLRAPQLMRGYWQNPEETAEVLRIHEAGRPWLHTGDLGYLDADGYLFIVDRKKDLIKSSGFQAWPREIEEVIASHPAVAEVGVAGVPDALRGETIKAWVVLRKNAAATEAELRAYCRERLAPYKVPSRIEFRDSLPKTMVGKVLRRALVAEETNRAKPGVNGAA